MSFQNKIEKIFYCAQSFGLCMDPEIAQMLAVDAPTILGISGGKDSA